MPRTRPEPDSDGIEFGRLGESLGVETQVIFEYVELGLLGPGRRAPEERATATEAARLSKAVRLARDLELHAAAAVMLIELLEERDALRRRIACLERIAGEAG